MRRTTALAAVSALIFLTAAAPASAAGTGGPAHALAMHGTPKYPADFKHFDYVNPDAPKGGSSPCVGSSSIVIGSVTGRKR